MKVRNLTPHRVQLETDTGTVTLEPEAVSARVGLAERHIGTVDLGQGTVPLLHERRTAVTGLPEPVPDTLLLVARVVAEAAPHRYDLVVPTHLRRNKAGEVVAALALSQVHPAPPGGGARTDPPGTLVVLCGSQPLPVLLTVATRRPPFAVLVHTRATRQQAKRLEALLGQLTPPVPSRRLEVADAGSGASVRDTLRWLGGAWELDYTGGTKVMAAHARLALAAARPDDDPVASYVDHQQDCLRFDDGRRRSINSSSLTLGVLAGLHGGRLTTNRTRSRPDTGWLHSFAHRLLDDLAAAADVSAKSAVAQRHAASIGALQGAAPWMVELRATPGLWLEWFTADRVEAALAREPRRRIDVEVGSRFLPADALDDAELDVLVRVGWRIRLFSCDTSRPTRQWSAPHKRKAIESQARARQVGGDISRAALVTLLEPSGVTAIERHLSPTEVNAPCRVFGCKDLQRWLVGELDDLREWCAG